jgi:hypothetical protein
MTMVIATPYLDEAERCSRVALMFDGKIVQTGSPKELRESLGLERLELRTSDLRKTEDILKDVEVIHDVQRFGDRLDLMVSDPESDQRTVRNILEQSGISVSEVRTGSPTLENTFVARLRDLQGEIVAPPFPLRRSFANERRMPSRSVPKTCESNLGCLLRSTVSILVSSMARSMAFWERTAPAKLQRSRCSVVCSTRRAASSNLPASEAKFGLDPFASASVTCRRNFHSTTI